MRFYFKILNLLLPAFVLSAENLIQRFEHDKQLNLPNEMIQGKESGDQIWFYENVFRLL